MQRCIFENWIAGRPGGIVITAYVFIELQNPNVVRKSCLVWYLQCWLKQEMVGVDRVSKRFKALKNQPFIYRFDFQDLGVLLNIVICVVDKGTSYSSSFLAFFCFNGWSPGRNRSLSASNLWSSQRNLYWWCPIQKFIRSFSRRIQPTQGGRRPFRLWWEGGARFHWCQFRFNPRCWILPRRPYY